MKYLMLMVFALAMFTACTKDYPEPIIDGGGNDTTEVSFTNEILPIFTPCAGCHGKNNTPPDLRATAAYDQLINGKSVTSANKGKPYIDTTSAKESVLYKCLSVGGRMYNEVAKSSDIALILKWIEQGAKNN